MIKIKAYTDLKQSRKLTEFLPLESADMKWYFWKDEIDAPKTPTFGYSKTAAESYKETEAVYLPCWSLAALLNILHSGQGNIPSLSGGGYQDGKYISDWCLDYEYDNGDYQKTFADNPIDACVEMIEKLHKLKML